MCYGLTDILEGDLLDMYGLDVKTDLSFLSGKSIENVQFGATELILTLTDQCSIVVYGEFQYDPSADLPSVKGYIRGNMRPVSCTHLTGAEIVDYTILPGGSVSLQFDNGDKLILYDSNREYPSYVIRHANHTLIV